MKVLMSAYACEPDKGGEPAVGWNWASQAARHHQVWILTRRSNRASVEAALEANPNPRVQFIYHDLPSWATFWKKRRRGLALYYLLWQLSALHVALRLDRKIDFDAVHHVTFNTVEMPGFLWAVPKPFIWGPVGGAQEPPSVLREYFGSRWHQERFRIWRKRLIRLNPLIRAAARKASVVLVANADTEMALRPICSTRIVRELETAVVVPDPVAAISHREFTVVWAGHFVERKGPALAIDVLNNLVRKHNIPIKLIMIGDGPLRSKVQQRAIRKGLSGSVYMPGHLPHSVMIDWYRKSDVLLFTSLHDTSGNVVLEAMANALPIVTLDHHGAAEMVTEECGIKIPIRAVDQVIDDLTDALVKLALDPVLRSQLGAAARNRAKVTFSWDQKGNRITQIYQALEAS